MKNHEEIYDALHSQDELRFPLEDYPFFYEWLNIPRGCEGVRLLDIACGQGFFLEAAEKLNPSLETHGIDFSQVALDAAARRLKHTRLTKASAYEIPYPDGHFDYITNLGSMEHFDDLGRGLTEFRRLLNPAGKGMVILPNQFYLGNIWRVYAYGEADDQGQEGVTNFHTAAEWKKMIVEAGLDPIAVTGYSGVDHIAWYFRRENGAVSDFERMARGILNAVVKPAIPLNLSQCFVFFVRPQVGARKA